jgi:sec-independent protein translocase protein TatB
MFGVDSSELAVVAILALIFIGPKDLPKVMRTAGYWVGRVRGMARHFTSGIETMVREAELEEMEKRWREENERIMRLHPADAHYPEPGEPDTMPPIAEAAQPSLPLEESQPGDELPVDKRPLP